MQKERLTFGTRPSQGLGRGCWKRKFSRTAFFLALLLVAGTAGAFQITQSSSVTLYYDNSSKGVSGGQTMLCNYASFQVYNNSVTNYSDLWVQMSGFGSNAVTLATNETGIADLGPLSAGQTQTVFFYLMANTASTTPSTPQFCVYPSSTLSGALTCVSLSLNSASTNDTNSNSVTTGVSSPNPPALGGILNITTQGTSGNLNAGQVVSFSPASLNLWPANVFELVSSSITLTSGSSVTVFNNTLLIPPAAITAATYTYTASFNFLVVNSTATSTSVSPVGYFSNGTPIKHNQTTNWASLAPVATPTNYTSLSMTANPTSTLIGSTVTYSVAVTNSGPVTSTLDQFVDLLPTSPSTPAYVAGSSTFNGAAVADPVSITSTAVTWNGSYPVPPSGSATFTFRLAYGSTPGTYQDSLTGRILSTIIDTNPADLTGSAPATASVALLTPTPTASSTPHRHGD